MEAQRRSSGERRFLPPALAGFRAAQSMTNHQRNIRRLQTWVKWGVALTVLVACQRGPLTPVAPTPAPALSVSTAAPTARPPATRTPAPDSSPAPVTRTPAASPTPVGRNATLIDIEGQVEVRSERTASFVRAVLGQVLHPGASVRTSEIGQATLQLSEGTIIRVDTATTFEFTEIGPDLKNPQTLLNLGLGEVLVLLGQAVGRSQFEVQTPLGVASVRGSTYYVGYSGPPTNTVTLTCVETVQACAFTTVQGGVTSTVTLGAFQALTQIGAGNPITRSLTFTDLVAIKADLEAINFPTAVISAVVSILNTTACQLDQQGTIICTTTPTP